MDEHVINQRQTQLMIVFLQIQIITIVVYRQHLRVETLHLLAELVIQEHLLVIALHSTYMEV